MTSAQKNKLLTRSTTVNRFLYALSISAGMYFLVTGRVGNAMSSFGLGLVFDPFDPHVSWRDRPTYQKVWLIAHVVVVFLLLSVMAWF